MNHDERWVAFAAAALTGVIAQPDDDDPPMTSRAAARYAAELADQMMAEWRDRNRPQTIVDE